MSEMWFRMVKWAFHPKPETKPIPSRVITGAPTNGLNGKYLTLGGKTSELIKILKPGQRMEQLYEQVHGKGKKAYFAFSRLHPDKPARTIAKDSAGLIHWEHNRTLTIGEYKRIAALPDNFKLIGSFNMALQRIGNSVPPNLMKAIANNIRKAPFMKDIGQPTVISTFAGCGGSSLGYQMAGFKELLAVEWDNNAVETFKLNFPGVPVYHGDIGKLSSGKCMEMAGIKKGGLDVLDGSPPCQGFSTAGKRKFDDPRNSLFKEYARLLNDLQPKVFVMENVTGMIKGVMKQAYLQVIKTLRECGYKAKGQVLNAMYYNVPQSRERVIIIGVRDDLGIEPGHPKPVSKPIGFDDYDDGVRLDGVELERWRHIPEGGNWQNLPKNLVNGKAKYSNFHRKTKKGKPCYTVGKEEHYSSGRFYHHTQPRRISDIELKRIASFPDNFKFKGDSKDIHRRIGNSVPPNMMKSIANHVKIEILQKVP